LHDFAAGCWAATVLAVYWVDRISIQRPDLKTVLNVLERQFFWAGVGCTAVVLLAGMGRTFTYAYIGSVYGEQSEQLRRKMLIIKHIVLVTAFGLGTWWQYTMAFSR
jgi:F0F1-type ATP synthase membrane subunit c/vacuolar-type H+-ATPase subunit K